MPFELLAQRSSKKTLQVFTRKLAVLQNLRHEAGTYGFTRMHWNHCRVTVRMLHVVVTSSDPDDFKSALASAAIRVLPVKVGSFVILRYSLAGLR